MSLFDNENEDSGQEISPAVSEVLTPKRPKKIYRTGQGHNSSNENILAIKLIHTKEYSNVNRIANHDHLTDANWHKWKERMKRVFINCDITQYVTGEITHPSEYDDPDGACNWDRNDTWAQQVIIHNVTASQMNHIGLKDTAEEMYSALSVTHDNMAHQMVNYIQNQLYETKSHDEEDLLKHLDILKSYHDHIN